MELLESSSDIRAVSSAPCSALGSAMWLRSTDRVMYCIPGSAEAREELGVIDAQLHKNGRHVP